MAYQSYDLKGGFSGPIPFNTEEYDYGNNYNPSTGIYTVPYDGLYLIHARVYSGDGDALHSINVDGDEITYTREYDPDWTLQAASTSITLHLLAGQEVGVDPWFTGAIIGDPSVMQSSFGMTLLYPD